MLKRAIAGTYKLKNGMAALTAGRQRRRLDQVVRCDDAGPQHRGTYTIKW